MFFSFVERFVHSSEENKLVLQGLGKTQKRCFVLMTEGFKIICLGIFMTQMCFV